jgi:hypothetical protein
MAGDDAPEEGEPRDGHHSPSERLCALRQDGDSRRSERDCTSTPTIDRVKKGDMATRIRVGSRATSRAGRTRREDRMHAAHELNGPTYAHAILTTAGSLAAPRRDA